MLLWLVFENNNNFGEIWLTLSKLYIRKKIEFFLGATIQPNSIKLLELYVVVKQKNKLMMVEKNALVLQILQPFWFHSNNGW